MYSIPQFTSLYKRSAAQHHCHTQEEHMTLTGTLRKAFATTLAAAMLIGTLAGC